MDNARAFEDDRMGHDIDLDETGVEDGHLDIAADERRMHVQAYNHWVSLLHERPYPSLADLEPANITDFGPFSVLLDFSRGIENPVIAFLGRALREECQLDFSVTHISEVPSRSLLSRLTDHYLQIIANRAPIGFEAEFVSTRGRNTLYRGILMPFSSDGDRIDFIYGVINWKELVDAETQAKLDDEVDASVRTAPKLVVAAPAWADGPSAVLDGSHDEIDHDDAPDDEASAHSDFEGEDDDDFHILNEMHGDVHDGDGPSAELIAAISRPAGSLTDQLMLAQQTAAAVRAADSRTRTTLYRALARAHDFAAAADADPAAYEALLNHANITLQLRAPMTPIVKLVFGADYDKTRLTEYATVLSHARRIGVATGALHDFLESYEGGIKGVVKAERAAKLRTAPHAPDRESLAEAITEMPVLAEVMIDTDLVAGDLVAGDYVVLLARVVDGGTLDVVAAIGDDATLTQRVMRQAID
ncbi:MAG: hypothetical protein ABI240_05415 [Sphingomonas sp.]